MCNKENTRHISASQNYARLQVDGIQISASQIMQDKIMLHKYLQIEMRDRQARITFPHESTDIE